MDVEESLEEEDYDALETLTSRFARVSDMLLQKIFRSIDQLEFEGGGTLLDALHRAEKRGLIDSVDQFRLIRELRNEIAHEYALDELRKLFKSVLAQTPVLFTMMDRIKTYCLKYAEEETASRPDGEENLSKTSMDEKNKGETRDIADE